jgi:hypothetical protein
MQYYVTLCNIMQLFRQGENCSSGSAALLLRKVCDQIRKKYSDENQCAIYCYMDDKTIICDPEIAEEVINLTIETAEKYGLKVNKNKSCVLCKTSIPLQEDSDTLQIPIADINQSMKVLGINITENYEEFNNNILERADRFFDSLDEIRVHPEIKHMLLHFCGRPRLQYYCETTPPKFAKDVVKHFQQRMKSSFSKIIGVDNPDLIRDEALYNVHGGNLPDYVSHHEELYNKNISFIELRSNDRPAMGAQKVELISSSIEAFTSLECSHDRQWTHFISQSNVIQLTPLQYSNALAFRMKMIPSVFAAENGDYIKCNCEQLMCIKNLTPTEEIELRKTGQQVPLLQHIIKCPEMHKTYDKNRHDGVKTAIRRIATTYGFSVYDEPAFYDYMDGLHNRPDLTFCIPTQRPYITTDITIVQPHENTSVEYIGRNAAEAAQKKIEKHAAAVHQRNHQFIPFALETTGHFDNGAKELIRILKDTLPYSSRLNFIRDMYGAVSTALAEYRAEILTSTLTRARTRKE